MGRTLFMTGRWGCFRLILLVLVGITACSESQTPTQTLTGTWVMELQLDSSEFRERLTVRHIRGTLTLAPGTADDISRGVFGYPATHSGRTRLDLRPFGFGERPWENVGSTTIKGDVLSQANIALAVDKPDGVHILTNPAVSHGGLAFDGRWRGSNVTGTWMVLGFVPMAQGRFKMHREP